jgi:hypothetical protein
MKKLLHLLSLTLIEHSSRDHKKLNIVAITVVCMFICFY